jgi:hypothetical protein
MISTLNVAAVALGALAFWTCVGAAITRRLLPVSLALPLAPTVGWAVHSVLAFPLFGAIGFSQIRVLTVAVLALLASWASRRMRTAPPPIDTEPRVPGWAYAAAGLLAIAPTLALLPKHLGDGIILAGPIYDHSKAAIVDEIARLGVPPGNPFIGGSAGAGRLVYYYLLHFSAAELSLAFSISGWAALGAMTWIAAFASLATMMGLAVRFGGRRSAALWVVPLALAGSLRPLIHLVWDQQTLDPVLRIATGFGGWLFQSAWVPQHLMSASCAVAAVLLMGRLAERGILCLVALALVVAAGFEASAWVCGVTFAAAAPAIGLVLLLRAAPDQRPRLVLRLAGAGLLTLVVVAPFLHDQFAALGLHGSGGAGIVFRPYDVLGVFFPERTRWLLDVPAYWLMLLVELPAIAVTGAIALAAVLRRTPDAAVRNDALGLALLGGAGVVISWLFASTLGGNNDLGWRSVLPAILVLTAFAAAGIAEWVAARRTLAVAAALCAIAVGLPRSYAIIRDNATGDPQPDAKTFAQAPAMWAAVRRHAAPGERVADNPEFLADITPWPANISWALLANRRSCYAGREFALVFTTMPQAQRKALEGQFVRVFAGDGSTDDVRELATVYDCRVVVVTPADGAWMHDPFAASPYYRLVESVPDRWRIYRAVDRPN